ncbi:MAG: hypothetical protein CUR32_01280 [Flavobacterium sp.]|jgi:hypothetical protein|nr:MAG: hypothetical protein CUR32_01280 [Flavobacterium sp.] [Flavobacterium sp. FEMGT703F]
MISKLKYLFVVLLFCACAKKITTLEEYANYPVKYEKTKISYPTKDFSMTIPKNWKWKAKKYNTEQIILGMVIGETDSITRFTKIISIQKYKSLENNSDLKAEFETILKSSAKNNLIPEIVESGKTNILKYDSYFIHAKSENEKSIEMISFIVKSKQKGIFYSITASCQNEDQIKTNLSMMIDCVKSFEQN